jgi:hypothetical protein
MCASHRSSNFPRSERSSFPAEVIIDMAFMRHYYLYISSAACMQALSVKLLPILATIWAEEFCGSLIGQGRWFRFGSYSWCTFKEPWHQFRRDSQNYIWLSAGMLLLDESLLH